MDTKITTVRTVCITTEKKKRLDFPGLLYFSFTQFSTPGRILILHHTDIMNNMSQTYLLLPVPSLLVTVSHIYTSQLDMIDIFNIGLIMDQTMRHKSLVWSLGYDGDSFYGAFIVHL